MKSSAALPWLRLLALTAMLVLAGCATPPVPETPVSQDLAALTQWRLEGKLGFRSPEKSGSAWVDWSQNGDAYLLRLSGPFGAGATRIEGTRHHAVLSQAGEEDIRAASAEELTYWLFGWPLPVAQMTAWVKAMPAASPAPQHTETDTRGLLTALTQKGWQLDFSDHTRYGNWVLPGRIKGTLGDYSFVLVIKAWHPNGGEPA